MPTAIADQEEAVRPPSFLDIGSKFATSLPAIKEPETPPAPAPKPAEAAPPTPKPEAIPPVAAKPPASPEAAAPVVEPPVAPPPPKATETPKPAEEHPPKNASQWETFKKNRAEAEEKLRAEIKAREDRAAELEAKLKEAEGRPPPEPVEPRPEDKARIEQLEGLVKEMSERITVLDVRENPLFKKHFETRTTAAVAAAKAAAGELAPQLDDALKLSGTARDEKIEEILDNLPSTLAKGKLLRAIGDLDGVESERQAEIAKAEQHKTEAVATRTANQEKMLKAAEAEFNRVVKSFEDPKDGFPILQRKEGDDAHNQRAEQIKADAKALVTGKGVKPDQVFRAAVLAATMPHALVAYAAEQKAWAAEKANLEAQIAELKGAQPGGGGQAAPNAEPERKTAIEPGIKPGPWQREMGASMVDKLRKAGVGRQ